jgi:hypothetical protein
MLPNANCNLLTGSWAHSLSLRVSIHPQFLVACRAEYEDLSHDVNDDLLLSSFLIRVRQSRTLSSYRPAFPAASKFSDHILNTRSLTTPHDCRNLRSFLIRVLLSVQKTLSIDAIFKSQQWIRITKFISPVGVERLLLSKLRLKLNMSSPNCQISFKKLLSQQNVSNSYQLTKYL